MTDTYAAPLPLSATAPRLASLHSALMWLVGVSGSIVLIEPSPYEIVTLTALAVFAVTGMRLSASAMPLLFLMIVVNIGYTIGAIGIYEDSTVMMWIFTSWYMAGTALFFAMALAEDTERRLDALCRGYLAGSVIAATAGIVGYLTGSELLTLYGRAKGTFKDPNVLGAFLVPGAAIALYRLIVADRFFKFLRTAMALGIISLALILAFSRAAIGMFAIVSLVLMLFMFASMPQRRGRILFLALGAVIASAVLLALLLSFSDTAELLRERASFDQQYDSGRFGRFGRHLLGAEMALTVPFGIGPLQFNNFFPEDTHNSYLNAFMSGGWISGIAYPALIAASLYSGFKAAAARTPWRGYTVALLIAFVATIAESFIIDTDHWRHFFLLMGTMWGLSAAARNWGKSPEKQPQ